MCQEIWVCQSHTMDSAPGFVSCSAGLMVSCPLRTWRIIRKSHMAKADNYHLVFICAAVINWITQKEPAPPSYQDKPWGVPRYPGTDWTTLVGDSSIPGPRPVKALGSLGGDAHPGSLVPGSLHLGRFGNSGEDLHESNASVKSAPESDNYATGSEWTSIRQNRTERESEDRQQGGL